jgi:tetratricopeptide (TPR) repeat protein
MNQHHSIDYSTVISLVNEGKPEKALTLLDMHLEQVERSPKLLNLKGVVLRSLGDIVAAKDYFARAAIIDPHYLMAKLNLSITYLNNRPQKVIDEIGELITQGLNDKSAHYFLALAYKRTEQLELSLSALEIALSLDSKFRPAIDEKLKLLHNLHRFEEMISYYEILIEDKDDLDLRCGLAAVLSMLGRFDAAISTLVSSSYPFGNLKIQRRIATIYRDMSLYKAAYYAALNSKGKMTKDITLHLFLGQLATAMNRPDLARNHFLDCVSKSGTSYSDRLTTAVALLGIGDVEGAFRAYPLSIGINDTPHVNFDNRNNAKNYISKLPTVYFVKHDLESKAPVVLVAADMIYADRFLLKGLSRNRDNLAGVRTHLHLMNCSDQIDRHWISKFYKNFDVISVEKYTPSDPTGYTTRRFIRLYQFIKIHKAPIMCIDADSHLLKPIGSTFNQFSQSDVVLYKRQFEPNLHQIIFASASIFYPTDNALNFISFIINYISELESRNSARWFADQMALLAAFVYFEPRENFNFGFLPTNFFEIFKPELSAVVKTFKGHSKNKRDHSI